MRSDDSGSRNEDVTDGEFVFGPFRNQMKSSLKAELEQENVEALSDDTLDKILYV